PGCFDVHSSVVGWSHSPWQPAKQSRAAGSHWATHCVPQVSVHIVEAIAVHPPLQPASNLSGVQSAVQPPLTSTLPSMPGVKSNLPHGLALAELAASARGRLERTTAIILEESFMAGSSAVEGERGDSPSCRASAPPGNSLERPSTSVLGWVRLPGRAK